MPVDWYAARASMMLDPEVTNLNSGSYGLLSVDVKEAFERYLTSRLERGSDWNEWVERGEAAPAVTTADRRGRC